MTQETVARILEIEKEAVDIHEAAEERAGGLIAEARRATDELRRQGLTEARERAERLRETAKRSAEAQRQEILAEAEAEAERMEERLVQNLDDAVAFLIDRVAHRE